MNTQRRHQLTVNVAADYLTSAVAVALFNVVRWHFVVDYMPQAVGSLRSFMFSEMVLVEIFVFPLLMLALYWLSGFYASVFNRSRLTDFTNALFNALVGTLDFFLLAMLNDVLPRRRLNYELIAIFFVLLTVLVTVGRWIVSNSLKRRGMPGRRVMIVGTGPGARSLHRRLDKARKVMGLDAVAFIDPTGSGGDACARATVDGLPVVGLDEAPSLIAGGAAEAIVISGDAGEQLRLDIVNRFLPMDISLFIAPDNATASVARRGFDNVAGEPLVDLSHPPMNPGMINVKRTVDVIAAATALIVLAPLFGAIALWIKVDSRGPVFYRQRRLGYHRRPFDIVKFRSMTVDAERQSGPALSSPDDRRITRAGRILRKYRLDELPNFWNVLVGDMSLVGPRPEREFFLRQIMERAPQSALLHRVRPGITSWGMVKYGYAQNVDEMIERLRYDLLYVENVSLKVDMKILFYTVHTVITGKGI